MPRQLLTRIVEIVLDYAVPSLRRLNNLGIPSTQLVFTQRHETCFFHTWNFRQFWLGATDVQVSQLRQEFGAIVAS